MLARPTSQPPPRHVLSQHTAGNRRATGSWASRRPALPAFPSGCPTGRPQLCPSLAVLVWGRWCQGLREHCCPRLNPLLSRPATGLAGLKPCKQQQHRSTAATKEIPPNLSVWKGESPFHRPNALPVVLVLCRWATFSFGCLDDSNGTFKTSTHIAVRRHR